VPGSICNKNGYETQVLMGNPSLDLVTLGGLRKPTLWIGKLTKNRLQPKQTGLM